MAGAKDRHARVSTRLVYFIPGHHPAPPRWYRARYRREGRRQASLGGYQLAIENLADEDRWRATSLVDGTQTRAEVRLLAWDDLIHQTLDRTPLQTFAIFLRSLVHGLRTGLPVRYGRARRAILIPVLYPYALLLGLLALGASAGWMLGSLLGAPAIATALFGATLAVWFGLHRDRFHIAFLLLAYARFQLAPGHMPQSLSRRIDLWVDQVRRDGPADEILIVGHSAGVPLAQHLAARLRRAGMEGQMSLLGLGSVTPLISLMPDADELRADLCQLAHDMRLTWVEFGAPPDGMSFGLVDPVSVSGIHAPFGPLILSARFSDALSEETLARQTLVTRHFQYLAAFDRPHSFDYTLITAGPLSLAQRFQRRAHSPSAIRKPAIKACLLYTSPSPRDA